MFESNVLWKNVQFDIKQFTVNLEMFNYVGGCTFRVSSEISSFFTIDGNFLLCFHYYMEYATSDWLENLQIKTNKKGQKKKQKRAMKSFAVRCSLTKKNDFFQLFFMFFKKNVWTHIQVLLKKYLNSPCSFVLLYWMFRYSYHKKFWGPWHFFVKMIKNNGGGWQL